MTKTASGIHSCMLVDDDSFGCSHANLFIVMQLCLAMFLDCVLSASAMPVAQTTELSAQITCIEYEDHSETHIVTFCVVLYTWGQFVESLTKRDKHIHWSSGFATQFGWAVRAFIRDFIGLAVCNMFFIIHDHTSVAIYYNSLQTDRWYSSFAKSNTGPGRSTATSLAQAKASHKFTGFCAFA